MKRVLLCQIYEAFLLLSLGEKNKKCISFTQPESIPVPHAAFKQGIVFNPSFFTKQIRQFLIGSPRVKTAIVAVPGLSDAHEMEQKSIALQLGLCFGKTGIVLERLIDGTLFDDSEISISALYERRDFFECFRIEKITDPRRWLAWSGAIGLCFCGVLAGYTVFLHQKQTMLVQECNMLELKEQSCKVQAAQLHAHKEKNEHIVRKIERLGKKRERTGHIVRILNQIAQTISPKTWLERVSIEPIKGSDRATITLNGHTLRNHDVLDFYENLTKTGNFKDLTIKKVQLVVKSNAEKAPGQQPETYAFSMTGTVDFM